MRHRRGSRVARGIGLLLGALAAVGVLSVAVNDRAPTAGGPARVVADDSAPDCSYDGAVCVPGWKTQDSDGVG